MATDSVAILLLPGWQNSGEAHWQTHWERQHGHVRVEQGDWQWPLRGDWMARLEEVLLDTAYCAGRPCCLVAHSLGCQLVAAWAAHTRHAATVCGALLVAPPDVERADVPPQIAAWREVAWQQLPFASTLVMSSDDPYCSAERAGAMAQAWGATLVAAGPRGHLNGDSGLGDWPAGLAPLDALIKA